jgi:transcriptional regulator with XRE-family HTH domain
MDSALSSGAPRILSNVGRKRTHSSQPIGDELPRLLQERGISLRQLAPRVGVTDGYLSRALRRERRRRISGALAERIARELDLEPDHFQETRLDYVIERLGEDGSLLDEVYKRLRARARGR